MVALHAFVALWVAAVAVAQRKYYNIFQMPVTNFDCRDKILGGYYADPEVNCQMFHVCVKIPGQGVQDFRFLCPNETVFDQENQICADSGDIDCEASGLFLENFDLYRLGSAPASKPRPVIGASKNTPIPLGPSTKSPILTNSVQEDDDFYLQRSETGDRRSHSKDILRGSSSSNLFNNRNRGKDLDDDDDDDTPRNINETPQSYRPKSSHQPRGKSQYNTQFRRPESSPVPISSTTTTTTTTTTTAPPTQKVYEEKKRTKIAVRKLARKRPTTPEEIRSTPASFTTQVTQKFSFGEPDQRYSTINRSPAPSSPFPQQPPRQYQQNFRNKVEQTTAAVPVNYQQQNQGTTASFRPNYQQQSSPTAAPFQPSYQQQNGFSSTTVYPNYRQNNDQSTTAFQPNYRQNNEVSTPAFFEPSPTPANNGFNGRIIVASGNFQQRTQEPNRQTPSQENFQSTSAPANFQNRQPVNQQFNRIPNNQNNGFNRQQNQPQQQFNRVPVNQNFNRQPNQQNNFNRAPAAQSTAAPVPQTRAPVSLPTVHAQTINAALQPRPTPASRNQYRNDDFEDNDKQEFLKTAPSSNFRPSDINSFSNAYKGEAEKEVTKVVSTTKYYTPTIVTTPKPTPVSSTAAPKQPAPAPSSNKKEQDNNYDYAYYDDATSFSEYDSLDPLAEQDFSRTSKRSKSRLI